jgi:hypothetical protein
MPRIIYPYFTVRTSLRMGQTIPILKWNSIGYTTKL